jgi:predicted component of viral defense system (DUF524 family)
MERCSIPIEAGGRALGRVEIFAERAEFDALTSIPELERDAYYNSAVQLCESCTYEFKVHGPFELEEIPRVVTASKIDRSAGRIIPGNYVGHLSVGVLNSQSRERVSQITLEVRSIKLSYQEDYRTMLEDISVYASELLMLHSSPVTQTFTPTHSGDASTLYQRFAFVRSLLDSEDFTSALQRIIHAPVTGWAEESLSKRTDSLRRLDRNTVKQIGSNSARVPLPHTHSLYAKIPSIPSRLTSRQKKETPDIPENRFVKYVLLSFTEFFDQLISITQHVDAPELRRHAIELANSLRSVLSAPPFDEISNVTTLQLNSPVLQRKAGYRDVLKAWLLFDLAAKLVWSGGDDVYCAGKRDVAVLYEYWVFFKLAHLLHKVFNLPLSPEQLIEKTSSGLGLKLKQGRTTSICGVFDDDTRKLNVEFSYNKSFSGKNSYPERGSWTVNFRPDYTLSLWPYGITDAQAEREELIVHIHFDAKYRLDSLNNIFESDESGENQAESKRDYRRDDLLKMHAYRDAIRRTAGAYILYPGNNSQVKRGFHEILPGLGAFSIRPNRMGSGEMYLENFLRDVSQHLLNRASHRELSSYHIHRIHRDGESERIAQLLPEPLGDRRALLPSETLVLIGYFKGKDHLEWIERVRKYNVRTGTARGALHISKELAATRYLLLYTEGEAITARLYQLEDTGPIMCSRGELLSMGYPSPNNDFYLVFSIKGEPEIEFSNYQWEAGKLAEYSVELKGAPFTVTVSDLMKVAIKTSSYNPKNGE